MQGLEEFAADDVGIYFLVDAREDLVDLETFGICCTKELMVEATRTKLNAIVC
jgi:hypothetical protein